MKACSFLPAATSMIYQMGLERFLHGVTFECPSDKPRVVRSSLEGHTHSSEEIERIVAASKAAGESLYAIDEDLLQSIQPDVIFTQDVCDVCQIDTAHVQRVIGRLRTAPVLVPLIPKRLDDVFGNARTIAQALGQASAAEVLLAEATARLDAITDTLRRARAPVRRVMVMEWLDPVYNCGHWIPDQIALAGGVDMLADPGGYSVITAWDKVLRYDPEVLVVAPCGFRVARTASEIGTLTRRPGWNGLRAVKDAAAFIVDADLFTRPSTTLVDGIALLARLFHPRLFGQPEAEGGSWMAIGSPAGMG
jgi:iron complex transport system substrate-binding protein